MTDQTGYILLVIGICGAGLAVLLTLAVIEWLQPSRDRRRDTWKKRKVKFDWEN